MLRPVMAAIAPLVLLSACAAQDGATPEPAPAPQASADPRATCGADKVASYVGALMSDEVLATIKSGSGAQTVRVVGPHDAMTMDFRQDRLTITTGEDGRIKTLRCV